MVFGVIVFRCGWYYLLCVAGVELGVISISLSRALRRLHSERERDPVPLELRGWSWDRPPVQPPAYLGLGVSDVAYRYCPTLRDVWLRRRGVRGEARGPVAVGRAVHEVFHSVAVDLRRELARGVRVEDVYERLYHRASGRVGGFGWWAVRLYRLLALAWAGEAAGRSLLNGGWGFGWLPMLTEYLVDGSPLGLSSQLRVDAVGEAGVVVEVKYGLGPSRRHAAALAGYALALEAEAEAPVDYGVLVYVNGVPRGEPRLRVEPVYIGPRLREEFLRLRDEAIDTLLQGEPPRATGCSEACPFYTACWG